MADAPRVAVFNIPSNRSFADALAAGVLRRHGTSPHALARGRILVPTNRAARAISDAFVRLSGGGLILPRLIAIGDPDLDERIGGALDPFDVDLPPAIDPLDRLLSLADLLRGSTASSGEAVRLAADLARALDTLLVEETPPQRLREIAPKATELATHWQQALGQFEALALAWPKTLAERGMVDVARRRSLLLGAMARRWKSSPPEGFTIAAGITTSAPAVAGLLATIARMPGGAVVLPGLSEVAAMPDEEWEALGPDEDGRAEERHPQFALKRLLDRLGVSRAEVQRWPSRGRAASSTARSRAVSHVLAAPRFTGKWRDLPAAERRLTGVRCAVFPDAASEAQGIALALREVLETPGRTAALITPNRALAARVSSHLKRWGIDADDSAGRPLDQTAAGLLLRAIVSAAEEDMAPVPLLALLKHPLAGGEGADRADWLDDVRTLDLALRGPRPRAGLEGIDERVAERKRAAHAWTRLRPIVADIEARFSGGQTLATLSRALRESAEAIAGPRIWSGSDGRQTAALIERLEQTDSNLIFEPGEQSAVISDLLARDSVRRPYGGHPRLFIWGLLEARLQHADLMILGGMNEGSWPAPPTPDPWLAPSIRRLLGVDSLESRIGLAAHDFASALGAPKVLLTRAKRDGAPTVASRFWQRCQAMTGGLARDQRLEQWALALDSCKVPRPVARPRPAPPAKDRPKEISVTDVDRLKADPFAFYAKRILRLKALDPVDADQTAAWKGTAVHALLEDWFDADGADPARIPARIDAFLADDNLHSMLRTLWGPRFRQWGEWLVASLDADRGDGRQAIAAEAEGEITAFGVRLHGVADRIDQFPDGTLGIIDYKTGGVPSKKAVKEGFALQLALLSLIAERGGFKDASGATGAAEYWSMNKDKDGRVGKRDVMSKGMETGEFAALAARHFGELAEEYLNGEKPFVARLHPAHAPFGDYDQLMRLDEWYGRADG